MKGLTWGCIMLPATRDKHVVKYRARSGAEQFKPSLELAMSMDCGLQGFCLACGSIEDGVEPDAAKDACPNCGAYKLYGASELILMGLIFHADHA